MDYTKKEIIIFDLDGTLAESKTPMDNEMSILLINLLKQKKIAIISGCRYQQFETQVLSQFQTVDTNFESLYLLPTSATCFYTYDNTKSNWNAVYREIFTDIQKQKIITSFLLALSEAGYIPPKKMYGELIEDRDTQISFSGLGQEAPVNLKKKWDPTHYKKKKIKQCLEKYIPEFEVRAAGVTTVDVTHRGIDKAYGIKQMEKHLGISKDKMLFIGDALFEGGNDYPVKALGVDCIEVSGPEETKKIINKLISEASIIY